MCAALTLGPGDSNSVPACSHGFLLSMLLLQTILYFRLHGCSLVARTYQTRKSNFSVLQGNK